MVSTRRSQTKQQARAYKVGDSVEVLRSEGVVVCTLLHKVPRHAVSPSSTSSKDHGGVDHWMVSIGNIEEDVSERMLGRVVKKTAAPLIKSTKDHDSNINSIAPAVAVESDGSTSVVQQNNTKNGNNNNKKSRGNNSARSSRNTSPQTVQSAVRPSTQQYASEKIPRRSRKAGVKVQLPTHNNNNNNNNNNNKQIINQRVHTTRAATRSAGTAVALFRGIEDVVIPPRKQPPKTSVTNNKNDGSVVKVPMLTGVLYLYRDGGKRWARFVRTK